MLKRLLAPTGSIFVHCDWHVNYMLRLLMDEIFGRENFLNEIIWYYYNKFQGNVNRFASNHDVILWYANGSSYHFQPVKEKRSEGKVRQIKRVWDKETGRIVNFKDEEGKIAYQETDERTVDDVWRLSMLQPADKTERTAFPTQKPLALLQRIIAASTKPGDLVLDAFAGSGTTAVAAETMKDADGKPAPRRWIAMDCGKFAVHISRKRLIEVGAQPFAVENVGFYARGREWRDLWAERPEAKVYRDAMVEIYGGTPVGGYAHLHGRKQGRWVHVGPIDAPIAASQVDAVLTEAAATEMNAVDILSADIPIDFNKGEAEERYGVQLFNKIIPEAAVEAVRSRVKRRQRKDAALEEGPGVHFFSPPDVEVGITVAGDSVTVKLLRLTVDLEECLGTQDPAKRAQIKARITDWRALVDYWAVDWDYREGEPFQNDWQSFRTRKSKEIAMQAANSYGNAR